MKLLSIRVLAAAAATLLLADAAIAPATAFVGPGEERAGPGRAETVQFFDRDRPRDDRGRGRGIQRFRPPPPNRDDEIILERRQRQRQQRRDEEQDRALDAVRRGQVLPLGGIIRSVQSYCPGTFLDASLQRSGRSFAYRVAILRPSGNRVTLLVDAASGAILRGQCR